MVKQDTSNILFQVQVLDKNFVSYLVQLGIKCYIFFVVYLVIKS